MTERVPGLREALAERVRSLVPSQHDVREVLMFGCVCFMVDQRMAVAAGRDGDLLVRTDPAEYGDLLLRGGQPAQMGKDRTMGQGWLTVPPDLLESDEALAYWVKTGIDSRNPRD